MNQKNDAELEGWQIETIDRGTGKIIMVVYHDGETRGSIDVRDQSEQELWLKAMHHIRSLERLRR